jgi:hypothetical protein
VCPQVIIELPPVLDSYAYTPMLVFLAVRRTTMRPFSIWDWAAHSLLHQHVWTKYVGEFINLTKHTYLVVVALSMPEIQKGSPAVSDVEAYAISPICGNLILMLDARKVGYRLGSWTASADNIYRCLNGTGIYRPQEPEKEGSKVLP